MKGKDLTNSSMTAKPLIKQTARLLREVHNIPINNCPFNQTISVRLKAAKYNVENCLADETDFDEIRKGVSAKDVYQQCISKKPKSEDLVFTHGDFCLPNIISNHDNISGFVDWSRAGIADRYQDLALFCRSFIYNQGQEELAHYFLFSYGLEKPDQEKIDYFMLLDEIC